MRFPPILNRAHFERSGYLKSFPHLAGSVHSFAGDERAHRELLQAVRGRPRLERDAAARRGGAHAGGVLSRLSRSSRERLPAGGRLVDVMSYCFRHEPSDDAGRMQMFRMHEHVRAADPETRPGVARAVDRPRASGRPQRSDSTRVSEVASDPFFGRGGKLLAVSQRDQRLKLEIVDADRQRRAADGDHLAQLPPGPLRPALRHPHRRRRGRPHRVCRLRAGADRPGALSAPRLQPRRWPPRAREALGL